MTKYILFSVNDIVKPINFYLDNVKDAFHSLALHSKCLSCAKDGMWISVDLTLNFFQLVYQDYSNIDIPIREAVNKGLMQYVGARLHPNVKIAAIEDAFPTER